MAIIRLSTDLEKGVGAFGERVELDFFQNLF